MVDEAKSTGFGDFLNDVAPDSSPGTAEAERDDGGQIDQTPDQPDEGISQDWTSTDEDEAKGDTEQE